MLLRVIAGLEPHSRGHVAFDGAVWQDDALFVPPHRRGVGLVFQDARLFPHLSVRGNLRYAARRAPRGADAPGIDSVVAMLDLQPLLDRPGDVLSGGEIQRVAIARALLAAPRLLLLDEPVAALDATRKAETLAVVERLRDAAGVPIVYVTHAVDELTRLADTMVLLSDGKVAALGPVESLMERLDLRPLTGRFEAGAVLPARVLRHDDTHALTLVAAGGHELRVPRLALEPGRSLRIRIRARDVVLANDVPDGLSIRNVLCGRVTEITAESGAFAEVGVAVDDAVLVARVTREAVARLGLAPGKPVCALIKTVALDRRSLGHLE